MRKFIVTVLVSTATLLTPAGAHALPAAVPGAFCSAYDPAKCYTHEEGDTLVSTTREDQQWILVKNNGQRGFSPSDIGGCSVVAHAPLTTASPTGCNGIRGHEITHSFSRLHKYRWNPGHAWTRAKFVTFAANDGVTSAPYNGRPWIAIDEHFNTPECYDPFSNPYITLVEQRPTPKPDAPADYVAYCFPNVAAPVDDGAGTDPVDPQPEDPEPEVVTPKPEVGGCGTTNVPKKGRVKIFRNGADCKTAVKTIKSFLKSGRTPDGWLCVSSASGKNRNAKCAKLEAGRAGKAATVAGSWRVR